MVTLLETRWIQYPIENQRTVQEYRLFIFKEIYHVFNYLYSHIFNTIILPVVPYSHSLRERFHIFINIWFTCTKFTYASNIYRRAQVYINLTVRCVIYFIWFKKCTSEWKFERDIIKYIRFKMPQQRTRS